MALFRLRHSGYKGGLGLLFVGLIIFIVGFASPNWSSIGVEADSYESKVHNGLWKSCVTKPFKICVSISQSSSTEGSWFTAVQALQCLALIGFLFSGGIAVIYNFLKDCRKFNRFIEAIAGISSVVGIIGAIVYVSEMAKSKDMIDKVEQDNSVDIDFDHVSWAFFIDVAGCVLVLIGAVLIAVFNRPLPADTPSVAFQPMPAGTTFAPGSPYGYANPAGPTAPYVNTNEANPPPYYIVGQPVAAGNPPAYSGPQAMGQAPLAAAAAAGNPPPVVSDQNIVTDGYNKI